MMEDDDVEQTCPHCGAPGSHRALGLATDNERLRVRVAILEDAIRQHRATELDMESSSDFTATEDDVEAHHRLLWAHAR